MIIESSLPFHPLINAWFEETYGKPTPVQEEAWPLITKGAHVLALAPTGSGKTLTGFLAAISRFAEGVYEAGQLSVLYVSPLKALNEDVRRNLILPLEGIKARFEKEGCSFPDVRVETRSGDTPQAERRRFLSRPPSILALTPESLGIILLNPRGRQVLSTVRYIVLDEIHAAFGSKRGCFLSCQIDRLNLVAGEFQRVALSATVKCPEAAAEFAGGLRKITHVKDASKDAAYEKRKVEIVSPDHKKELQFKVIFPDAPDDGKADEAEQPNEVDQSNEAVRCSKRYKGLISFILERIAAQDRQSGTIIVFTDSRRRAERISYLLNQHAESSTSEVSRAGNFSGRPLAYCHHGSLSKEVRRDVEKALAAGEIPCVVATGSLELGIDIGSVDEVILAGSPGSAAVALQRLGRSGHKVGMTSRGWLIPFHGMDLLQAAAVAGAVEDKELEETFCIESPLDLLAQIILSLLTEREWNEDELFNTLRGFYVYRNLSRVSYDGVVRMLSGAFENSRVRELQRRIFRDDETKTLSAAPGALLLLYTSGGVITSRGYYSLRLAAGTEGAGTKIGELDEEFVWERRLGDCFDFGNRSWRITKIGDEAVEAIPLSSGVDSVPFWKGETVYRSSNLSRRMQEIQEGYYPKAWTSLKAEKMLNNFSDEARKALEEFLHSQWAFQKGIPLAAPDFIPVEVIDDPENRGDAYFVIFHSYRGGAVNCPLSLALSRDIEAWCNMRVDGAADDNAIFIKLPRSLALDPVTVIRESLARLCAGGKGEERFRERLESSAFFGAAFREAAERSLILPRAPFGKRTPLWLTRQKSKRLFDAVSPYKDFPVTAEAWRTCLMEQFDMEGFRSLLEDIESGALSMDFFVTRLPSPFSKELFWTETSVLMYQYDERLDLLGAELKGAVGPSLSDQVIAEAIGAAALRPTLKADLVEDYCSRLRREIPGWAPEDVLTLCEWVKERVVIPTDPGAACGDEWEKLLKCVPDELAEALREDKTLGGKLEYVTRNGAKTGVVLHREAAKKWKEAKAPELAAAFLGQWLRYEGPVPAGRIADVFGLSPSEASDAIDSLSEGGDLAADVVVEASPLRARETSLQNAQGGAGLVCDRENLELLLRLGRRKSRPQLKEKPASLLIPFLARRQGLVRNGAVETGAPWKNLCGIAAPAKLWEAEFFPYRCHDYSGEMFDKEIREGRLLWYGAGKEKAAFCRPEDMDLVLPPISAAPFANSSGKLPAAYFDTPRSFWEIKDALAAIGAQSGAKVNDFAAALWQEVWRGALSSDSWEPLRRALESGFARETSLHNADYGSIEAGRGRRALRLPRAVRERWRTGPPVSGNWFSLAADVLLSEDFSFLEEEELNRDRVRLLLDRWGILCRPLLEREAPLLSWAKLLPAMRRLELAGELVAGRFFGGINSLQFASPRIADELEEAEAEQGLYWMNAADPASPAGLAIEGLMRIRGSQAHETTVRRVSSSRLCFKGSELLALSNRDCKELSVFITPDDPLIRDVMAFVTAPKTRRVHPENKIIVDKINGESAARSVYSATLKELGFVNDRGKLVLW